MTTTIRRRAGLMGVTAALILVATACPVDPPGPTGPYHPEALTPGNKIHVVITGSDPNNFTIANPGGVAPFPADPAVATDLFLDTEGLGDPTSTVRLGPIATPTFHVGVFDGSALVKDLGPWALSAVFSADGSTLAFAETFSPTPNVVVYDTDDWSVRRTIAWDAATLGRPAVLDVSRDGSTIIISGSLPPTPGDQPDGTLFTASTSGTATPVAVAPAVPGGEVKYLPRITNGGRVAYWRQVVAATTTWELRTVGIDGTNPRTVTSFEAGGTGPGLAAEIGTGRLIAQIPVPGSTTLSDIVVYDDVAGATGALVADDIDVSSGLKGLTRLVTPA